MLRFLKRFLKREREELPLPLDLMREVETVARLAGNEELVKRAALFVAEFVWSLPAGTTHGREDFGLFRHSLRLARRKLENLDREVVFNPDGTVNRVETAKRHKRLQLAAVLAALFHDTGKAFYAETDGEKVNPPIAVWLRERGWSLSSPPDLFFSPGRFGLHEFLSLTVLGMFLRECSLPRDVLEEIVGAIVSKVIPVDFPSGLHLDEREVIKEEIESRPADEPFSPSVFITALDEIISENPHIAYLYANHILLLWNRFSSSTAIIRFFDRLKIGVSELASARRIFIDTVKKHVSRGETYARLMDGRVVNRVLMKDPGDPAGEREERVVILECTFFPKATSSIQEFNGKVILQGEEK